MLIYHCRECNVCQDVTLAEALTNILNEAAARLAQPAPVQTPIVYPCPYGHGPMVRVFSIEHERIGV
jgi:hypothetical protein